jgi:SAM-dependent methyltransferase
MEPALPTLDDALRAADSEAVAGLDLSCFSETDLVNLILQRSEILADHSRRPKRIIRAWVAGDDGPVREAAAWLGADAARRAAGFVYLEYCALRPLLRRLAPRHVADIGCGYGFFDLFLQAEFNCSVTLIDTEDTDARHFGFKAQGASYASLPVARRLLTGNGCPPDRIATLNPGRDAIDTLRGVDLAVSFLACGFHFPWQVYAGFFQHALVPDGSVILDLRQHRAERDVQALGRIGTVEEIGGTTSAKVRRVHLRKTSVALRAGRRAA